MESDLKIQYSQTINMPQMALSGLSESWMMKEVGNCHWHMLCEDLGLKSNEIFDLDGNRLYATFVRIKTESCNSLKDYNENECLEIVGNVKRFGGSLCYSEIDISCNDKSIKCTLATTFSTRESDSDNNKITRGVPNNSGDEGTFIISEIPKHISEIIKIKKQKIDTIQVSNIEFKLTDKYIYEKDYKINPYTDINGVGLLYFAAYPIINDMCEFEYFNNGKYTKNNWALNSSTMTRDVLYFGNCNIDDVIYYRLNSYELISEDVVAIQSSLYRQSDNSIIAKIFTIKNLEN
jgi:probable biosynthetic protein (TIGR04098 family)